jgi:hypothetical protein
MKRTVLIGQPARARPTVTRIAIGPASVAASKRDGWQAGVVR